MKTFLLSLYAVILVGCVTVDNTPTDQIHKVSFQDRRFVIADQNNPSSDERSKVVVWIYCSYIFSQVNDDTASTYYIKRGIALSKEVGMSVGEFNSIVRTLPKIFLDHVYHQYRSGLSEIDFVNNAVNLCGNIAEGS